MYRLYITYPGYTTEIEYETLEQAVNHAVLALNNIEGDFVTVQIITPGMKVPNDYIR